jgi:hypothetical protein
VKPKIIGHVARIDSSGIHIRLKQRDKEPAASNGVPRIGQLGSYVIVPLAGGRLVGFVNEMYESRPGDPQDGQIMASARLIGAVREKGFVRGVYEYPVVGDAVCAATDEDFACILGSAAAGKDTTEREFTIGKFAMNEACDVRVRGREFFSKHIFVAGNTGSGKSCTAARILQEVGRLPGTQVVLFDLHDEYRAAFTDASGRVASNVTYLGLSDLILPYWLLSFEETERLFVDSSIPAHAESQSVFLRMAVQMLKRQTARALGLEDVFTLDTPIYYDLRQLALFAENLNDARYVANTDRLAFADLSLRTLPPEDQEQMMLERRCEFHQGQTTGETTHPVYHGKLIGLVKRIDKLINDCRYDFVFNPLRLADESPDSSRTD